MSKRIVIAAIVLSLSTLARAGAPGADRGQALVDAFVSDVRTLSARFEQRLIDANGDILEVSSGTLDVRRPGQFHWAYAEPYEQQLVADGVNVWSYDVDLAQVTVKPQSEALANTPALLLGGSRDAMDGFVYDGSYEAGGLTWARLHPTDTDSGFRRVELAFENDRLVRMVFLDNLEQTTVVALYEATVNGDIDPSRFEFNVPDGVDLVGTPAVNVNVADSSSDTR
ncbi:MAG: outer membrane lipoprotein chaperone LolA [Woeseiaceae bacterium]|nr:outer membrane lipoprotein chaperone LolA [Woeseiaceae bacterium]